MIETERLCRCNFETEVVFAGYVLQVAVVSDLLDMDKILSDEDDVIEVLMPDAGMKDELDHRRANNGFRQHARLRHSGGGRLDRAHHETMSCQ